MFEESEEICALRDSLLRLIEREFPLERIKIWERDDDIGREEAHRISAKLSDLGVLGLCVPEEWGGFGRQVRAMAMVQTELAKRATALSVLFNMSAGWGGMNISESGSEDQKRRFLPGLLAGETLFAFGLTEPNVGADLSATTTRAERIGDRVVINGAKRFNTGANVADYIYALVRSGPREAKRQNLSFVLIPTDVRGVTITPIEVMGTRGVATCEVFFENVEIPFANVMGEEAGWNDGWRILTGPALEVEKITPITASIGVAEAALEEAWEYSQQRVQGGKRICGHQAVRHVLAEAQAKLLSCRLMLQYVTWLIEARQPSAAASSMAKLVVTETAKEIVLNCQQYVMGAYGYAKGFQMERYVRDILLPPIAGGSSAIQKNNIASLLRLPRE